MVSGTVPAYGMTSTAGAQFRNMLQMAVPYQDSADRVRGSAGHAEWVNAYRVARAGSTTTVVAMPAAAATVSGATVTVPQGGVVLVAHTATTAGKGLKLAAARGTVPVTLDTPGWNAATSIVDGKFQMVAHGAARTRYPGWPDSWPGWARYPCRPPFLPGSATGSSP